MLLPLLGIAALLGVGAFFVWDRHSMAVARIEGILRARHASAIQATPDWLDFHRNTLTYDVRFTAPDGVVQHRRCKVAMQNQADDNIFWSPPL